MSRDTRTKDQLVKELEELRSLLAEKEETLNAIRNGEVDAIVVSGSEGDRVFSLTSAETPYRIIVEVMNEGAATLSAEGTILYCNQRFAELCAAPPEEIVGSQFTRFVAQEQEEHFQTLLHAGVKGRSAGEIVGMRMDGDRVHLHCSFSALPGHMLGDVCAVITDITEVKQKEEALLEVNKELEAFAYTISHDLRAPVRAIDGFTRLLEEKCQTLFDEEGKRLFSLIKENSLRMGQLIDNLLSFSRLGRAALSLTWVDMKAMAHSVFLECTDEVMRKRIEFRLGNLHNVWADHGMIHHVWMNLIDNAIKFSSHQSHAVISITSERHEGLTTYCIKDNGVGFDMKYVGKLFGVFERLHAIKDFEGTGVGLAIVQRVIGRHGGRAWARGKPDGGASIFFSLPDKPQTHQQSHN